MDKNNKLSAKPCKIPNITEDKWKFSSYNIVFFGQIYQYPAIVNIKQKKEFNIYEIFDYL